MFKTFQDIYFS